MLTFRNAFIGSLLLLAAGLSTWSLLLSKHAHTTQTALNSTPDAYMEEVVATTLNKEGKLTLKLVTPKMTHYPQDDSTEIISPKVVLYRHSPNPWFIHSEYAKATHGITQIDFIDHVNIHHLADINDPPTTMETLTLTVFPEKQLAQTEQPVTITQPNTVIHAIGMLADLNVGTVNLLSQAKGEYVPNS